jgi:TonB family protein
VTSSRAWVHLLIASAATAGRLQAQLIPMPHVGTVACTADTAGRRDTMPRVVSLRAFAAGSDTADRVLTSAMGALVREQLVPPPSLAAMFFPYTYYPPAATGRSESSQLHQPTVRVYGTLRLILDGDGRLRSMGWIDPTGDESIDAALSDAVHQGEVAGELRQLAPSTGSRDREIRVQLVYADSSLVASPLVRLRIPLLAIDSPGNFLKAGPVVYPPDAKRNGLQGSVTLEYVIDESGRAMPSSLHVVSATDKTFIPSAKAAILQTEFRAASSRGCAVKSLVEQRVVYTLGRQ